MFSNGVHDCKIINIQVISVYESIFVRNIIHITFYLKKSPKNK